MIFSSVARTLTASLLCSQIVYGSPGLRLMGRDVSLDDFIKQQSTVSANGVLANIGPDGSKAEGLDEGVLIASPSKDDPNYFFTWTRDSSLTFKILIERFIGGDDSLGNKIKQWIALQAELQDIHNPSGAPGSGGLGEPRFNVDKTANTGEWGRPQRDGPALRATALIIYANWLVSQGRQDEATQDIWPIISTDLAYTVTYWNQTGFDLWEETMGSSFFTLAASHRALVEGDALASELGQSCKGCKDVSPEILCFLQSFWTGEYIRSDINPISSTRSGKNANSILTSIHVFDPAAKCADTTFQPCSSRALSNHKAVVDSFRSLYGVNKDAGQGNAVAVGRYAEDEYYGGNPWYLTTAAAAEQLYAAIHQWEQQGSITIDSVSLPFFQDIVSDVKEGSYEHDDKTFSDIVEAVRNYADGFIAIVQKYTPEDGAMAEQFSRDDGSPKSAVDLTWSYASFLSAADRRNNQTGSTWNSDSSKPSNTCHATPTCTKVDFTVKHNGTLPGDALFIVGNIDQLSRWDPNKGIELDAGKWSQEDPVWSISVDLPANMGFEFKFLWKKASGEVEWEGDANKIFFESNRVHETGGCGGEEVSVEWNKRT